jgi:hypothetical protein
MKPLSDSLDSLFSEEEAALARQAADLRRAWGRVAPASVLGSTGSVIYDKRDPDTIVVFTDSAFIKAELSADKELYRLMLSRLLRPGLAADLREVRFAVSRRVALARAAEHGDEPVGTPGVTPLSLSEEEEGQTRESLSVIKDERLKLSLYKAMKAQLEWKKGKDALKEP